MFGTVYFKRDKKAKFSVLAIPIGTVQFGFAVKWRQYTAAHIERILVPSC